MGRHRMALVTLTNSRAIALYERRGFIKTRIAEHPSYERYLRCPGRVLMEKQLSP